MKPFFRCTDCRSRIYWAKGDDGLLVKVNAAHFPDGPWQIDSTAKLVPAAAETEQKRHYLHVCPKVQK